MDSAQWLLQSVRYFRDLGFFQGYRGLSDQELAQTLQSLQEEEWEKPFDPSDDWADVHLLAWDEERVWWSDTEADVGDVNRVYEGVLPEWAAISRGAFLPGDIEERWDTEEGSIAVHFTLDGATHTIHPQYLDDWIDMAILDQINPLITHTGYQFEMYAPFDQTAFVLVLTAGEKHRLIEERHWDFCDIAVVEER